MRVRIGIDVGGTFTDAVAINHDTLEILGFVKVLTSHNSKDGVALGIINAIYKLISTYNVNPYDVVFIATGTTQATNALLEGDVDTVGVICIGTTPKFKDIYLNDHKYIPIKAYHIKTDCHFNTNLEYIFNEIIKDNIKTIVACCPFSTDTPIFEEKVVMLAKKYGIYVTATHEISQLYGIKIRTNTAIINACLMPKMVKTFDLIKQCIKKINIQAPIMVMRCDGGVMSIDEVKKRPFLTILSGPCASVYGALIHNRISNGIFLEVGGTSTDISVIKNGNIMCKHAQIGKHKLYLNSLDIHTIGIAGGSLIRISNNKIDIGPRSAHILGLKYSCFCNETNLKNASLTFLDIDGESYIGIKNDSGETFAITLTCVCNALSLIDSSDYSYGNKIAARCAISLLAQFFNTTVDNIITKILDIAANKCISIIHTLITQYNLASKSFTIFGGGGACSVLVPFIATKLNCKYIKCKDAPIISSIGVCLSMLREVVEKTVFNPSEDDIKNIKLSAISKLSKSLANTDLIETYIEFDKTQNILRATATSSIDLSFYNKKLITSKEQLIDIAMSCIKCQRPDISIKTTIGKHLILQATCTKKVLLGLISRKNIYTIIVDTYGIILFCELAKKLYICTNLEILDTFENRMKQNLICTDAGYLPPKCVLVLPNKLLDLSTFLDINQMISVIRNELDFNTSFDVAILIF